jgi:hypothetical protein
MVEDSQIHNQEDVSSKPDTVYWMDASYYIERKTIKVAKWGTPKKKKKGSVIKNQKVQTIFE